MIERWGNDRANRVDTGYIGRVVCIHPYRAILSSVYAATLEPVRIRHHTHAINEHVSSNAIGFTRAAKLHPLQARRTFDSNQLRLRWRNKRDRDTRARQPLRRNSSVLGIAIDDSLLAGQIALREKLVGQNGRQPGICACSRVISNPPQAIKTRLA